MGGIQSTPDAHHLHDPDSSSSSSPSSSSCFILPRPLSSRVPILTASSCDDSIGMVLEEEEDDEIQNPEQSSSPQPPQLFNIYQTDSTISVSSQTLQLPFRKCSRPNCSPCSPVPTRRGRRRLDNDNDLVGLWIPLQRQDSEDSSGHSTTLRWMPKSHSERHRSHPLTPLQQTSLSQECDVVPPLERTYARPLQSQASSEYRSKEQRIRIPPSVSDVSSKPIQSWESQCDDVPTTTGTRLPVPSPPHPYRAPQPSKRFRTIPKSHSKSHSEPCHQVDDNSNSNQHRHKLRSRSEDFVDGNTIHSPQPPCRSPLIHKPRSNSIDPGAPETLSPSQQGNHRLRFGNSLQRRPSNLPKTQSCRQPWMIKSHSERCREVDTSSKHRKPRSRSEDVIDLHVNHLATQQRDVGNRRSYSSTHEKKKTPDSPTSVMYFHQHSPAVPTAAIMPYHRPLLQTYRNAVKIMKEQRRHDKVGLATLYHQIGLIHYQESRYSAALCIFNHALELLSLAHGCWTLQDALPMLGPQEAVLVANLLLSRARLELSMGNRKEAKRTAKMALQLLSPQQHSILLAQGLVVLAQTYQEDKPERAMKQYQQALAILRYLLGEDHVDVALTIYHIGNLHTQLECFDLAKDCYTESLRIYQIHGHAMDICTSLASLGWIQLLQNQNELALQTSMEALRWTCSTPRNAASIHYQIGLVQLRQGQPERALQIWKQVLKDQRSILLNDDHWDIARTLEAVGMAYQDLERWTKSRNFLEGAVQILEHPKDLGRVQARLAHVWIGLGEDKRAQRAMERSAQYFRSQNLPPDDMVGSAKQKLLERQRLSKR